MKKYVVLFAFAAASYIGAVVIYIALAVFLGVELGEAGGLIVGLIFAPLLIVGYKRKML